MEIIDQPHKHIKEFNFLSLLEFERLIHGIQYLDWELYNKRTYIYKVCGIDYENIYYKENRTIIEKFVSDEMITSLSKLFDLNIKRCNNFTLHKMEPGDYSLKHTDKNRNGEIARIVYYLSHPDSYDGGELVLYSKNGKMIHEKIKMPPNSFIAFRLIDKFYHEVNKIESGIRYCAVATFI